MSYVYENGRGPPPPQPQYPPRRPRPPMSTTRPQAQYYNRYPQWSSAVGYLSARRTKTLYVSYSFQPAIKEDKKDRIPRHKEITPDPADDFTMMNTEAYELSLRLQEFQNTKITDLWSVDSLWHLIRDDGDDSCKNPKIIDLYFEVMKDRINEIIAHKYDNKIEQRVVACGICPGHIKHPYNLTYVDDVIEPILSSHSILLPVINPDYWHKQSKINKLVESNMLLIRMKQYICMLQWLIFDTSFVSLQDILKIARRNCLNSPLKSVTVYQYIQEALGTICDNEEYYAKYNVSCVVDLFVTFYMKCDSNREHLPLPSLVGILYNQDTKQWRRNNFLGPDDGEISYEVQSMSTKGNMINKLLFRGYQALSLEITPGFNYNRNTFNTNWNSFRSFVDACKKITTTDEVVFVKEDLQSKVALTTPLLILPFLQEAKTTMRTLLISLRITGDCADIILSYLYENLDLFYSISGDQNSISVKSYELLNYLEQFDTEALNNNERFKVDADKISTYLFQHHEHEIIHKYFDGKHYMAPHRFLKAVCCMVSLCEKELSKQSLIQILATALLHPRGFNKSHLKMLYSKYHSQNKSDCQDVLKQAWTEVKSYWEFLYCSNYNPMERDHWQWIPNCRNFECARKIFDGESLHVSYSGYIFKLRHFLRS
eukprot:264596_1